MFPRVGLCFCNCRNLAHTYCFRVWVPSPLGGEHLFIPEFRASSAGGLPLTGLCCVGISILFNSKLPHVLHPRWAHIDKCWAGGPHNSGYGLSYCVDRIVDEIPPASHSQTTRSSSGENRAAWPAGGGGNFVDITLRVVVRQATGTLMAFQPEYPHGTTRLCGAHNRTCAITFSTHILDAYKIAVAGAKVESGLGAGEGSRSGSTD